VTRVIILIISLILLNHCSFNENSRIWKDKEKKLESEKNIKKVFSEEKKISSEFNQELKLDLTKIKTNNKIIDNKNNYGAQKYGGLFKKIGTYKFGKFEEINQLNFKPVFLENGLIFFDKKGSIIRYNNNKKVLWKKNHYSKAEKKQKPKLNFVLDAENLLVTDSVAKYYSININSGELNWSKNNTYPFNSDIKKHKDKFFVIDYKNTLRCYEIINGNECWNLKTEDSFTISNSKLSLIIVDDLVVFSNSIGDITAADIETGLIIWQLPTQSSSIINETYNFKISKLVSDGSSIYFSNNKNEFYSIDLKNGIINWKNEISSNITPVITGNLIFTVSEDGYLLAIEKNKGNIIRVTDLFNNYKLKKRKNIQPVGFAIDDTTLYLSNSDGKMILADLSAGNIKEIVKVSGDFISRPFIFSQNLFIIRNGSIVQYN
jgi:outer membrane protein assembly factor BamB